MRRAGGGCFRARLWFGRSAQANEHFLGAKFGEQFVDRLGLTRQEKVRRDLVEGRQHEPAQMSSWMGQDESGGRTGLRAESEEIEIQRTWFVEHLLGLATKFCFQGLELGQQGFRRLAGARSQAYHGVNEWRRAGGAIDGRALPERRFRQRLV